MSNYMSVPVGSVFTVGSPCGSAGGAMFDPPSHMVKPKIMETTAHCWMMWGPPIIIEDTYMSVKEGFSHVNYVFHTFGDQPALPSPEGLEGPIA